MDEMLKLTRNSKVRLERIWFTRFTCILRISRILRISK